jgi:hypothetical protein
VGGSEYEKGLGSDLFPRYFYRVFELPSSRNAQKRDETKKAEEKLTSKFLSEFLIFFDMGLFVKTVFVVFLNSPCQETPKNVLKKKAKGKKSQMVDGGWVDLGFSKCMGGSVDCRFLLCRPLAPRERRGSRPPPAQRSAGCCSFEKKQLSPAPHGMSPRGPCT